MSEDLQRKIDQTISDLETRSAMGDPDAQFDLFVFLNAKAMEEYDVAVFDKAEQSLVLSAESGWADALESLKSQKIRRRAFEGRVRRNDPP